LLALPDEYGIQMAGLRWLENRVNAQGALTLVDDTAPHWTTSLLVLTLTHRALAPALRERAITWLLSWQGLTAEPNDFVTLNSKLVGWPWISETLSWVEPTSYAILALKRAAYATHPRVQEAELLLLDRECTQGGWNYGNHTVLERALDPFMPTTALALLALQDVTAAQAAVTRGLAYLTTELQTVRSTLSLALSILCLQALEQPTATYIPWLLERQRADGSWRGAVHLTALAALALYSVTEAYNVFKI